MSFLYFVQIHLINLTICFRHKNKNNFTSVCCHPEDNIIATGDCLGKIHIWRNIFDGAALTVS